jgi:pyrroline-5-carboxylate reductase
MKIGFAGAGNIAAAMARGWASADRAPDRMLFCDAGSGRAAALAEEVGGEAVDSLAELGRATDVVALAFKPGSLEIVAEQLQGQVRAILSLLGATPLTRLRARFEGVPVLRAIPNVGTEIQRGVICHTALAPEETESGEPMLALLGQLGHLIEVPDELLDQATALTACPPAYVAIVAQNLAEAGAEAGLDPELSYQLVVETFVGTSELLRLYDPVAVRTAVASPGGSTEAGLQALAEAGAADSFRRAVEVSVKKMRG